MAGNICTKLFYRNGYSARQQVNNFNRLQTMHIVKKITATPSLWGKLFDSTQ